jgi:23S rRNA (adenine2503-C2)-methyltransferase
VEERLDRSVGAVRLVRELERRVRDLGGEPLAQVLAACEAYYARRRRKVFIEYVMLAGVNDTYVQATALAQLLDPRIYKVNLIPYNPTGDTYQGSSRGAIAAFKAVLEEHGFSATVRLTRGQDIDAACGQLAAKPA